MNAQRFPLATRRYKLYMLISPETGRRRISHILLFYLVAHLDSFVDQSHKAWSPIHCFGLEGGVFYCRFVGSREEEGSFKIKNQNTVNAEGIWEQDRHLRLVDTGRNLASNLCLLHLKFNCLSSWVPGWSNPGSARYFQRCRTREDSSLTTSGSRGRCRHRNGRSSRMIKTRRMMPHTLISV